MSKQPRVGDDFGRYRLVGVVGRGGMGVVFAAEDAHLSRRVALKILSPELSHDDEYRRRFRSEASVLSRLNSPHVLAVLDHGDVDGVLFLTTPLIDGGDLAQLLHDGGPLSRIESLTVVRQVVRALRDAHEARVLHRDVKPSNVLLMGRPGDRFAYLCDFGIARVDDDRTGDSVAGRTVTGAVAGTFGYLAPERIDGARASVSSDVYAVGCLLWACLSGAAPYRGSAYEVMHAHHAAPVPALDERDDLDQAINNLLARTMAKGPGQRHPDAEALLDAVDAALDTARHTPHATRSGTPVVPRSEEVTSDGLAGAVTLAKFNGPRVAPTSAPDRLGSSTTASGTTGRRTLVAVAAALGVAVIGVAGALVTLGLADSDEPGSTPAAASDPATDQPSDNALARRGTGPSRRPGQSSPVSPAPTTAAPTELVPVTATVHRSCGTGSDPDCFVQVRSAPVISGDELYRVNEGETLSVVCQVVGDEATSSVLGTTSSVWVRTVDGGYAAKIYLDGIGDLYTVTTPCP